MKIISKQLTLICFVLWPIAATTACLPPTLIEDAVEHIDMAEIEDKSIESKVALGKRSEAIALRLSRQYYEITIIDGSKKTDQAAFLLGMVKADTSIINGVSGTLHKTSFIARREGLDIQLLCADDSILSDLLLREEIMELIRRTGQ